VPGSVTKAGPASGSAPGPEPGLGPIAPWSTVFAFYSDEFPCLAGLVLLSHSLLFLLDSLIFPVLT